MLNAKPKRRKPPPHLGPAGADLWRNIVHDYAIQDAAGLTLATTAGECLDRIRAAQKSIAEHGEIVVDRYGSPKCHPALALEKDARNGLLAALKALNLDLEPLRDAAGRPPAAGYRRT
jgi:phage terminase small subunit